LDRVTIQVAWSPPHGTQTAKDCWREPTASLSDNSRGAENMSLFASRAQSHPILSCVHCSAHWAETPVIDCNVPFGSALTESFKVILARWLVGAVV